DRQTSLSVVALLPPGEETKALTPGEPHRHPRGADLVLLISTPEGERPDGAAWKQPDNVTVTRETDGGATGRSFALQDSEGGFRFALDEVRDGMTVWLSGGDFVTRTPYVIQAVDPPRPRQVSLSAKFPAYTRLNARDEEGELLPEIRPVRGAKATVPVGTEFELVLDANKPLAAARVTIDGEAVPTVMESVEGETAVRVPLTMLPPESDLPGEAASDPFPPADGTVGVRPGARVAVELEDEDGIRSQTPVRLVLSGVVDEPPAVQAEPTGVSDALTRTASLPFVGLIDDDYGVATARFLYKLEDARTGAAAPPVDEDPEGDEANAEIAAEGDFADPTSGWRERRFRVRPRGLPDRFNVGDPDSALGVNRPAERF
ncbi:MAG: hypothetical protein AAF907_12955, partial [Planctomycetota bacterium]